MSQVSANALIPQEAHDDLAKLNKGLADTKTLVLEIVKEARSIRMGSGDGGGSLKESARIIGENKKKQDELTVAVSEYNKILSEKAKLEARLNALESENARQLAVLKVAQQERNGQLKAEAQLQNAVNSSIDEARAKVKLLTTERNALNLSTQEGRARLKELNAEIDKNNEFIKANVDQYTKQKINIGNYSGALTILETELTKVRQLIEQNTKAGNDNSDMLASLAKEEALLTQLLENQITGFASATGELRNNEKALQQLAAAGLQSTDVYKQLLVETAQLKDNVGDLKAEIRNLASDTKLLDGAVGAAQALAGAYGIAVAATQLFGEENEEFQKSMIKLQNIATILIGLQQIQNALQKESSIMLFLNAASSKIAAAGQTLFAFATGGATTSLKAFRWALIGTGIGALIVLLGTAANAMGTMADSTDDSTDAQKKHNEELEKEKKLLNDVTDASEKLRNSRKGGADELNRQVTLLKAKGATDKAIFDAEQALRNAELRNLRVREASGLDVKKEILDKENEIEAAKLEFKKAQTEKSQKLTKEELDKEKKALEEKYSAAERVYKRAVDLEIKKRENQIKANQDIIDDENSSDDAKLSAMGDNYRLRAEILNANAELEKEKKGITAEEIRLIEEQLTEDLKALGNEYLNADIELMFKITQNRKEQAEEQKENLRGLTEFYKKQLKEQKDAEEDLKDTKIQFYKDVADAVAAVGQISMDGELKRNDERMQAATKEKEMQLAYIESLNVSDERRRDLRYKAEQEAFIKEKEIAKDREEIEKRKFLLDKAAAFAKIWIDAQLAVNELTVKAAAATNPVISAAIAAKIPYVYGSAAVSSGIIAAQVFAYEFGTDNHPGGAAIVGEGIDQKTGKFKKEIIKEPGKAAYVVDEPTFMPAMPQGTKVTPIDSWSDDAMLPYLINGLSLKNQNNSEIVSELKGVREAIKNIPIPNIEFENGAMRKSVTRGNNTQNWIKRNIVD